MAGEFIHDEVFDGGLDYVVANGTRLDICSAAPTSYAEATSTYTLGNKTSLTCTGPANASAGTGRAATVPAINDGSVTGTNTATHWGLTNASDTLIAAGPLSGGGQSVTSGNTFTLDSIEVIIRDATVT